jgi:CBS domain containing-hemolysin-like protein
LAQVRLHDISPSGPNTMGRVLLLIGSLALLACPSSYASSLSGDTLETVAEAISYLALIFTPLAGIYLFWIVHILPEKIAERRKHPQAPAIKILCLLSLFFGGMLWPLAWLWAYTKPSLFRLAYGRDRLEHHEHDLPPHLWHAQEAPERTLYSSITTLDDSLSTLDDDALRQLQARIEQKLASSAQAGEST